MKFGLAFALIGVTAAGVIQIHLDQEWEDFKQRYAKSYRHDAEEVGDFRFSVNLYKKTDQAKGTVRKAPFLIPAHYLKTFPSIKCHFFII